MLLAGNQRLAPQAEQVEPQQAAGPLALVAPIPVAPLMAPPSIPEVMALLPQMPAAISEVVLVGGVLQEPAPAAQPDFMEDITYPAATEILLEPEPFMSTRLTSTDSIKYKIGSVPGLKLENGMLVQILRYGSEVLDFNNWLPNIRILYAVEGVHPNSPMCLLRRKYNGALNNVESHPLDVMEFKEIYLLNRENHRDIPVTTENGYTLMNLQIRNYIEASGFRPVFYSAAQSTAKPGNTTHNNLAKRSSVSDGTGPSNFVVNRNPNIQVAMNSKNE